MSQLLNRKKLVTLDLTDSVLRAAAEKNRVRSGDGRSVHPKPADLMGSAPVASANHNALTCPGGLEKALEDIRIGFLEADINHRTAIDQQVMSCFRVARFLQHHWRGGERILAGEWHKHRRENGQESVEALRFVYKKTHADPKKASFYYRATRALYEEKVKLSEIPARVNSAGGYQVLADRNAKTRTGPTDQSPTNVVNQMPESDHHGHVIKPTAKRKRITGLGKAGTFHDLGSPHENESASEDGRRLNVSTTFGSEGTSFFDLSLPCLALLNVKVSCDAEGVYKFHVLRVSVE